MIERDYIMRMIQLLVQALLRILFLKKGEQYPEALNEIQKASKKLVGVELDVLRRLPDTQIIDLLSVDASLGIPKCYAAAILMKEEAEILELQKKTADSIDAYVKSLSLLTETAIHHNASFDSDHAAAIDLVTGKLNGVELPVHIHKKLFRYYEIARRYARAEDMVFEIIEKEPSFVEEGIRFYARLKSKRDGELTEGDLSRKEIEDGLKELQRLEQRRPGKVSRT